MTAWLVSQGDVESHSEFGKSTLKEILHSYGMDVTKEVKTDGREKISHFVGEDGCVFGVKHRSPFTGKIHTGVRYIGTARTDGRWKDFTKNFKAK